MALLPFLSAEWCCYDKECFGADIFFISIAKKTRLTWACHQTRWPPNSYCRKGKASLGLSSDLTIPWGSAAAAAAAFEDVDTKRVFCSIGLKNCSQGQNEWFVGSKKCDEGQTKLQNEWPVRSKECDELQSRTTEWITCMVQGMCWMKE